jgi:hypothetical protein
MGVACGRHEGKRNGCRVLVENLVGKRSIERPRLRWI